MKKIIIYLLLLILIENCTEVKKEATAKEAPIQSINDGEAIYKKRCTSCHGMDGKLGFSGAKDLTMSSLPMTMIEMQVTQGKGAMNGFEKILSPEEIKSVSLYAYKFRERI